MVNIRPSVRPFFPTATTGSRCRACSFSPFMVLYPVYYVVFWYVILYSVISTYLSKEIVWKGNKYTI